jgi:peptide-methionine (S)-S-oxide reductase
MSEKIEVATLAGGCFWCTEAIFKRLKGVISVMPGYAGGHLKNPSYDQVCSGTSGHAESLQIEFDPMQISFEKILNIFWHTHNPTTLNQQGNDVGSQYRSAIFYHNKIQKELAEKSKVQIEKEGAYTDPIVTEITPYINFYAAENYHKDYFDKNREAPYCNIIISPKIKKLLEIYSNDIKEEYKQ